MSMRPAGNQWLTENFKLTGYILTHQSFIGRKPSLEVTSEGLIQQVFGPKYAPAEDKPLDHLEFALKYDDLNLDFLSAVFKHIPPETIASSIQASPSGKYYRRIGFLYEFLTGQQINLNVEVIGNYVDLLDGTKYITANVRKDRRWRINNNLPGTRAYCPVVRKTRQLSELMNESIADKILKLKQDFSAEIYTRAIQYLYRKETRSSFEIEKEKPSPDRTEKFIALLQQAGDESNENLLSEHRLTKLQHVIVDPRFAATGFRDFQNYIGQRLTIDHEIIHYICPPPSMVAPMMEGLRYACDQTNSLHPAVRAAILSFGFVFIHPFEDGNGRLHRFLIHDLMVQGGLVAKGQIIPISAHMLNHIKEYDAALEDYSKLLMNRIKYTINANGDLSISNLEKIENYFRYPDLTQQCIYLLKVILRTIEEDLPVEFRFIQRYDEVKKAIQDIVDMPDKAVDLMILFLHQNLGLFPKRKRDYFPKLTDDEIHKMQAAYRHVFEMPDIDFGL